MNLKQLEAFVKVADGRSFSKAAKELYLTQPTISAHIASLEKELNVRLFVRNTKEVNLSDDGHKLYKYARQMIELEQKIEQVFSKGGDEKSRCITIAASTIPAQYLLPDILVRFSEKYPAEQFQIMETDSAKVVEQVINQKADIGFTGTVLEKKHCSYIPFFKDQLVVILPNNERYRGLIAEVPLVEWIVKEPIIMRENGSGTRKEAEKQLKKLGISPEQLNIVASIENQETIKRSVISGMGIAILSKLAAQQEIEEERMLSIPMPAQGAGRDLNVVYNKNYQLSGSAERFVRLVKQVYGINK